MIGKIKGKLVELAQNQGLIETSGGVFYQVYLPPQLLSFSLPKEVEIYTYLQVRDDALILFGFETKSQHDLFTMLLSVSGVGPKTAFSLISFTSEDELLSAVRNNDVTYFSKVPGLGKKTAMKIILELSTKLKTEFQMKQMYVSEEDKTVIDALISLGFSSQQARETFQKIPRDLSVEEKIKQGLRIATAKD